MSVCLLKLILTFIGFIVFYHGNFTLTTRPRDKLTSEESEDYPQYNDIKEHKDEIRETHNHGITKVNIDSTSGSITSQRSRALFKRNVNQDHDEIKPNKNFGTPYVKQQIEKRQNILLPNVGLYLKYQGEMEAPRALMMLYVRTSIPNITQLINNVFDLQLNTPTKGCKVKRYPPGMRRIIAFICEGRNKVLTSLKESMVQTVHTCDRSLNTLKRYIPQLKLADPNQINMTNSRRLEIIHLLQNRSHDRNEDTRSKIFSTYSGNQFRMNLLQRKINDMNLIFDSTLDIDERQISLLTHIRPNQLEEIHGYFRNNFKEINSLTYSMKNGFELLLGMIGKIHDELTLINFAANMTYMTNHLIQNVKDFQVQFYMIFHTVEKIILLLEKGYLPKELISPTQVQKLLEIINKKIYQHFPNLEPMVNSPKYYYYQNNIIYKILGYDMLIQIPVYLRQIYQLSYSIYSQKFFYVPYVVNEIDEPNKSYTAPLYTRIDLPDRYVAISSHLFISQFSNTRSQCKLFANRYVCEGILLPDSIATTGCLSSLLWNQNMETIAKLCPLKLYQNPMTTLSIYEDEHHLLLVNIKETWTIQCNNEHAPRKVGQEQYCLISKKNMCLCKLKIAHKWYFIHQPNECESNTSHIYVLYPINGLVTWYFRNDVPELKPNFDFFATYYSPYHVTIPILQKLKEHNYTHILLRQHSEGIDFRHIPKLAKSQDIKFTYFYDKLWYHVKKIMNITPKHVKPDPWHKPSSWTIIGLSFISIATSIFIIIVCFYSLRLNRNNMMAKLLTGIISTTNISLVKAKEEHSTLIKCTLPNDHTLAYHEFKYRLYLIIAALMAYLMYYVFKWVYDKYLAYKIFIPQMADDSNNYKCHVYIEIVHDYQKLIIYCSTIAASMHNVSFHKNTRVIIDKIHNTCTTTYINLKWIDGHYKLFRNIKCYFPNIIHVPTHQRWKAMKMLRNECNLRVLILSDVYYSLHPLAKLSKRLSKQDQKRKSKLLSSLKAEYDNDSESQFEELYSDRVGTGSQGEGLRIKVNSKELCSLPETNFELVNDP